MNCKLITENDCAISAVLSCSPVEFLIISKAIARCSESTDYAEADRRTMVLMSEAMKNFLEIIVAPTGSGISPQQSYEQIQNRQRKNGHNRRKISPQTRHLARQIYLLDRSSIRTYSGMGGEA